MERSKSPREIAKHIVGSADSIEYLADALLKHGLPEQWRYGPALELRVRFDCPLNALTDSDLSARLSAVHIEGPVRPDRLNEVGRGLAVNAQDMLPTGLWRPRGFGLWHCDGIPPMGVKVYPSKHLGIDLLIGVPQPFLQWATRGLGFHGSVERLAESHDCLKSFCERVQDSYGGV